MPGMMMKRPMYKKGGKAKKDKKTKGKYPSKGMNALAKKRPDVAKKIMGYKQGGSIQIQGFGKARH